MTQQVPKCPSCQLINMVMSMEQIFDIKFQGRLTQDEIMCVYSRILIFFVACVMSASVAFSRDIGEADIKKFQSIEIPEPGNRNVSQYFMILNEASPNLAKVKFRFDANLKGVVLISSFMESHLKEVFDKAKKDAFYHGGNFNLWDFLSIMRAATQCEYGISEEGEIIVKCYK